MSDVKFTDYMRLVEGIEPHQRIGNKRIHRYSSNNGEWIRVYIHLFHNPKNNVLNAMSLGFILSVSEAIRFDMEAIEPWMEWSEETDGWTSPITRAQFEYCLYTCWAKWSMNFFLIEEESHALYLSRMRQMDAIIRNR